MFIYIKMATAQEVTSSNNNMKSFGEFVDNISKKISNMGETWNGDFNYNSLGDDIDSMIIGMTQKLLNNIIQDNLPKTSGVGSKRKGCPGLPKDSTLNIPESFRQEISQKFNMIMEKINSQPDNIKALYLDMMFLTIFHERAIPRTGHGKGNRSIAFYLWHEMYKHMPETCLDLLYIIPEYGCFRDLDNIMNHYIIDGDVINEDVVNRCVDVYHSYICKDFYTLFNIDMNTMSNYVIRSKIESTYNKIKRNENNINKKPYPKISLVGKYIGRENKKFSFIREPLIIKMFCDGDKQKYDNSTAGFKKFTQVTLRYLQYILNTIVGTVEMKMSSINYKDIDPTKMTSGASLKYRKYLLNVDFEGDERVYNEDAQDLRERTLVAAMNNMLNGAGLDSVKLANVIGKMLTDSNSDSNSDEREIVNAQFNSLFESIKDNLTEEYNRKMLVWEENGCSPSEKPLDPFNVIATIDVSGSMTGAGVMDAAIILGIIVTKLSNIGNTFMTFSDNPELITINVEDNIFDIYNKVHYSPWGGSTNIDKANKKLANLMNDYKTINSEFTGEITHIIFTDGQFDPYFVQGWNSSNAPSYYSYTDNSKYPQEWNTAVDRMEKYFTKYELSIPNTIFWNMNAKSPGFPATSDMRGLQLAEGLSHGMLVSILTNACEFTEDNKGIKKANVSPIQSFHKTIYNPYFENVTNSVHQTKEGVFNSDTNIEFCNNFIKQIN